MAIEGRVHSGRHGGLIERVAEKNIHSGRDFRGTLDTIAIADRQRRDAPDARVRRDCSNCLAKTSLSRLADSSAPLLPCRPSIVCCEASTSTMSRAMSMIR